jgi:hypothetical protein
MSWSELQSSHIDEMNLLAVASVHGRPQGEILQVFHNHLISCKRYHGAADFCRLLTHNVKLVNWTTLNFTDGSCRGGQKNTTQS